MATTKKTKTQMDAVALLTQDHDEVRKMFTQFEKARDSSKQLELAQKICMELTVHASLEESSFYPEVEKFESLKDMVLESLEEHRQAKELIAKLKGMPPTDEHFEPDMKVLMDDVEHHAGEEEKQMFPKLRKEMGKERLTELGRTLEQQKMTLKTRVEREMMPDQQRVTEEVKEPSRAHR